MEGRADSGGKPFRIGCWIVVAILLTPVGCVGIGAVALRQEIARVRVQCTPDNLLEVYQPDLFQYRSQQTRGTFAENTVAQSEKWNITGELARPLSSIPFTSETWVRRSILSYGSTPVAALKFIGIDTAGPLVNSGIAQGTPIFKCGEIAREFYIDKFEHEFGGNP